MTTASARATRPGRMMGRSRWLPWLALTALLAVTWFAYQPGLGGPVLHDDYPQLWSLLDPVEFAHRDWRSYLFSNSGPLKRPVAMASFIFDAWRAGNDLQAWKTTNLFVHLLAGLLLAGFLVQLFGFVANGRVPAAGVVQDVGSRHWWPALFAAGLWLLHPLHVSTTLYTVQRMTSLSALFVLLGLFLYSLGRVRQINGAAGAMPVLAAYLLCLPLAALSKENGLLLPLFLLLLEVFLFHWRGSRAVRRLVRSLSMVFLFLPLLAAVVVWLVWLPDYLANAYQHRPFTLEQRLMTQLRIVPLYLFLLVLPMQRYMGFYHDDIALSLGWLQPATTLGGLVFIVALLWLAFAMRRRAPLVGLGIVLFFAGHLMESTILPLELVYEHRNYMPAIGVVLVLGSVLQRLPLPASGRVLIGVLVLALASALTTVRSATWSSYADMLGYWYRVHPQSEKVVSGLAEWLVSAEDFDTALQVMQPFDSGGIAFHRLFVYCARDGRLAADALPEATARLRSPLDSYPVSGLIELGRLGLDGGCEFDGDQYLRAIGRALSLVVWQDFAVQKLQMYRAHFLYRNGDTRAALAALEDSYAAWPDGPMPLFLATEWMLEKNQPLRAKHYYDRAVQIVGNKPSMFDGYVSQYRALLDDALQGIEGEDTHD